ncbi:hypothetical protein R1sor_001655 [Riccia sorocarpa]|uniref:Uncharacterized protein n=1 Tax=Riccia sorocarpa TaxID=122646 RepID=A0ABD3GXE2_9MARC
MQFLSCIDDKEVVIPEVDLSESEIPEVENPDVTETTVYHDEDVAAGGRGTANGAVGDQHRGDGPESGGVGDEVGVERRGVGEHIAHSHQNYFRDISGKLSLGFDSGDVEVGKGRTPQGGSSSVSRKVMKRTSFGRSVAKSLFHEDDDGWDIVGRERSVADYQLGSSVEPTANSVRAESAGGKEKSEPRGGVESITISELGFGRNSKKMSSVGEFSSGEDDGGDEQTSLGRSSSGEPDAAAASLVSRGSPGDATASPQSYGKEPAAATPNSPTTSHGGAPTHSGGMTEASGSHVGGSSQSAGVLKSILENCKIKRKTPLPPVPLCMMKPTSIVRSLQTSNDLDRLKDSVTTLGYLNDHQAFSCQPFNMEGVTEEITDDDIRGWNEYWRRQYSRFLLDVKGTEWEFMQKSWLFIWDGNHRWHAWMDYAKEHSASRECHLRVKTILINGREKQMLLMMHFTTMNR